MPYHAPDEHRSLVRAAAERAGTRARHEVLGTTVEGRPIDAVRVAGHGRTPDVDRPQALVLGGLHGVEVIGTELALAVLEHLVAAPPGTPAATLLEGCDVVVVPTLNVDGRTRSLDSLRAPGVLKRGAPRRNARGIDLNRNWPFPTGARDSWLPIAGTGISWLPWYRGPAPLSEPETAALAELARELRPFALLNLHSAGEILTYPWASRADPPEDAAGFQRMIEAFRARQRHATYRAKQSSSWYPILGASNDWFYDTFGTMALTVEISVPGASVRHDPRRARWWFWWANPLDPDRHVENDLDGCVAALLAARSWRAEHPWPGTPAR